MNSLLKLIVLVTVSVQYCFGRVCRLLFGPKIYAENDVQGKVTIVTGANSGIGKEAALGLAKRGAIVVMGCRNMTTGKKVQDEITRLSMAYPGQVDLIQLDLSDLSSVRKFSEQVLKKYPTIDILINNAGIMELVPKLSKTKDGFETHMGVNHLGHFLLTHLLLDALKKGAPSRVVVTASTVQRLAQLNPKDVMMEKAATLGLENMLPYCNSKFANGLFAKQLGDKLKGTGVTTYSICPGMVDTPLLYKSLSPARQKRAKYVNMIFGLTPEQGAETILYCALAKEIAEDTGKFYRFGSVNKYINRFIRSNDELGLEIWNESEKLVGLKKR